MEPMQTPVRLGLVGLSWGARVAEAMQTLSGVTLAGCFARHRDSREAFARRFGCRFFETYETMLDDERLDGVILMTPNDTHRTLAVQALAAGKHALVTKPIAASLVDAAAMIETAKAARRILAIGHQSRRQPGVRKMKEAITRGVIGVPVMIEGNTSSPTGAGLKEESWRESIESCPGGPLLQLGIHYIDNFQYLLGPVRSVSGWQRRVRAGAGNVDTALTLFQFRKPEIGGTLASSYVAASTRWTRVSGTEGALTFDTHRGLICDRIGAATDTLVAPVPGDVAIREAIAEEIEEFAHCIRTGAVPEIDGAVGARNLAVVLAAVKANEVGSWIEVERLLAQSHGRRG